MKNIKLLFVALMVVAAVSCGGLHESDDLLVWRPCEGVEFDNCDQGQVCLPHQWDAAGPSLFRCRDFDSLSPTVSGEPLLAYCDGETHKCPKPAECRLEDPPGPQVQYRKHVCVLIPSEQQAESSK